MRPARVAHQGASHCGSVSPVMTGVGFSSAVIVTVVAIDDPVLGAQGTLTTDALATALPHASKMVAPGRLHEKAAVEA